MPITINIKYKGTNGSAKSFVKEMIESGIVDEIRKEDGNLKYEYFISYDDSNVILLVDSWINQEALDNHHNSLLMKKIIELRDKYNLTMEVNKFTNLNNNISDEKYIKK